MRICSPELGISPISNSGGEVHDREVLTALARAGAEVEILLPRHRPYDHTVEGWRIEFAPITHVYPPYLYNILVVPYLRRTYRHRPFDILRVHSPYFVGLGALYFRRFHPAVPLVTTYHHLEPGFALYNAIDRRWIRSWDRIVTVSEFTRQEILKTFEVPPNRVVTIHNGIAGHFQPQPKDRQLARKLGIENKRVVLFLGGLKARKNLGFLLDIFAKLKVADARLVLAGAGPEESALRARAHELKIADRVVFTGYLPEDEKVAMYNLADVFVLPSEREGFGMVATEAMACGKPVLVPRSLAFEELVTHGHGGMILSPGDTTAWTQALEQLLRDEERRRTIGEAGRKRVRHEFSWLRAAQRHLEVYQEATEERQRTMAKKEG